MANKELKTMLYMCAMAAVKHYPEFRDYFERKKKEGKNGISIINAIKNKLVLRVASVVSKQTPYVGNYKIAAWKINKLLEKVVVFIIAIGIMDEFSGIGNINPFKAYL